jgi:maleylacetoacetate isomerase
MTAFSSGGIRLYGYFRSSSAWRLRLALGLKGLSYEYVPVNLLAGEQDSDWYGAINPSHAVPTLVIDGHTLSESLPIMEYLEETRPSPPLLPADPFRRAKARQIAETVNSGIQPLQNAKVLARIEKGLGLGEHGRVAWARHWVSTGLDALEAIVAPVAGSCCVGDAPTMADVLLVPQLGNARRFQLDVARWPTLDRIDRHLAAHPVFVAALPGNQPDCPPELR